MSKNDTKSSDEESKEHVVKTGLICFGVVIFAVLFFLGYGNFFTGNTEYSFANMGAIGDSFGVVTCIASLVTVVLVYLAWQTQRAELRSTREELEKANDAYEVANKARDEANKAYVKQLENNERNNFFNEFKELVKPFDKIRRGNYTAGMIIQNKNNIDLMDRVVKDDSLLMQSLYRLYALLVMIDKNQKTNGKGLLTPDDKTRLYTYMNLQMNYSNFAVLHNMCEGGFHYGGGYVSDEEAKRATKDWVQHNLEYRLDFKIEE